MEMHVEQDRDAGGAGWSPDLEFGKYGVGG